MKYDIAVRHEIHHLATQEAANLLDIINRLYVPITDNQADKTFKVYNKLAKIREFINNRMQSSLRPPPKTS